MYAAHLCSGADAFIGKVPDTIFDSRGKPGRTGCLLQLLHESKAVTRADLSSCQICCTYTHRHARSAANIVKRILMSQVRVAHGNEGTGAMHAQRRCSVAS